ncbi:CHAT domain-containing tetratricopeptide repeat protein [Aquabacterium humicola]|uniref:CHAT domain-containing tetratricopeptide repeat protein n=1 Tax=Aquabacterium humicola TaxID=3237377 RepID=UPI002542B04C|nr:CHAT domain-containing protein [Rubrivivax pictus]
MRAITVLSCSLVTVALLLSPGIAAAQADERTEAPSGAAPNAAETARLRERLLAPIPPEITGAKLNQMLVERIEVALRHGDRGLHRDLLAMAMDREPTAPRWPNDLAIMLADEGRFADSEKLVRQALSLAKRPVDRLFFESRLARLTAARYADDEARTQATRIIDEALALQAGNLNDSERIAAARVIATAHGLRAHLEQRRGRHADSLAALKLAEKQAQEALALAQRTKHPVAIRHAASDLAQFQKEIAARLVDLDRFDEAAAALDAHRAFIREHNLPPGWDIGAAVAAANLRYAQRDFAQAETHLRRALALRDQLGTQSMTVGRVDDVGLLTCALWAMQRSAEAWREIEALDARARGLPALAGRVRMPFSRGLVLLGIGRAGDAAKEFDALARSNLRTWGEGHYAHAQAEGLQGVALWRSGSAASRDEAHELLRRATTRLLSPQQMGVQLDRGIRPLIRTLILSTYVEAAAARGGLPALLALGVADGLGPGVTAQAMAAAALRGASGDEELRGLVRDDQDAQHEMQALQVSLAQGGNDAPPPEAAQKMRARLVELEQRRAQVRVQVRARYPAYDQLASPPQPNTSAVAQLLAGDEALVFLLPREHEVLVWAITAQDLPQFVRVELAARQLEALVMRVRKSVEFGRGPLPKFDVDAARQLHDRLIAPVAPALAKARHLVIATSGPLGSLPFAALVTGDAAPDGTLPWLMKRWTIGQVPSVSAWLSLRALPPARPAPEPLIAWGDPAFALPGARGAGASTRAGAAFRYGDLPPLPESRDELQGIATSLKADAGRDLLLGAAATRDSVLAASRNGTLARKRVVVFATHGLVSGDLPGLQQPALALAAAPGDKTPLAPLLTLDDVLALKLNAEWVVLSACNTAAPDGRGDEALSGLARGFLYAGSRTLLATHWAVETESAKRLTTATFEHRATNPGARKAESLRQAMLALAGTPRYAHPAYWAPFVLLGDGGP